ncbi:hypothetical protein [Dendronalium phyllosphericum]|nr:hypothetical protein [Dendronalium phyllosphericum]
MRCNFADGIKFSAKDSSRNTTLLTISQPIGLVIEANSGAIHIKGEGHDLAAPPFLPTRMSSNQIGLQVKSGNTLGFIGNNIFLEGGTLTAREGRVELNSINDGLVNIFPDSSGWNFSFGSVSSFSNIDLSNRAFINANGNGNSSIHIQGKGVILTDGSVILIQNQGITPAGALSVTASEFLKINGSDPVARIAGSLRNESLSLGAGGDIKILVPKVILENGGQINTLTFGKAPGGNIFVNASDSVQLLGVSPLTPRLFSLIAAGAFGSGNAGNITLSTPKLVVKNGSAVTSSNFGSGQGGNVILNAANSIEVTGYAPVVFQPSTIASTTFNTGNAGSLTINTSTLIVQDGGTIDASTLSSGNSGSVTINASDSVTLSGKMATINNPSSVISSASTVPQVLQQLYRIPPIPSGESGDVTINTPSLSISNGGLVSVRNEGIGNAGNVNITTNRINIFNNGGGISATTAVGEGGDIKITSNIIQLSSGNISATAGQQGTSGNGGNIIINTHILTASNNSAITANAFEGRGGNIRINTQGLFISPKTQITTTSQRGIDGIVQINFQDRNPEQLKAQPEAIAQTPKIASVCPGRSGAVAGKFVIRGRESAPAELDDPLYNQAFLESSSIPVVENQPLTKTQSSTVEDTTQIVEAQGWVFDSNGQVTLVATKPNEVTPNSPLNSSSCSSVTPVSQLFPLVETSYSDD